MTTVSDDDLLGGSTGTTANGLNSLDNIHTTGDLTEDDMLTIQPAGDDGGDEELATVGVGTSIGHGQETGSIVSELEVLIGKLGTIDGLATGSVSSGKVTTLKHELGDDTVEGTSLIGQAFLVVTTAQGTEVLGGLWDDIGEQFKGDATEGGAVGGEIEENDRVGHDGGGEGFG